LCNLVSIAERVGAPRIVRTRGIPYPTGDPSLDAEAERAWRRRLLERALEAVSTQVQGPTVFEP
jgi:glycine reductase